MFQLLKQLFEQIRDFFWPKSYASWQTVVYLSVFSWLTSLLAVAAGASRFTSFIVATFSWIFLAIGVGWGLDEAKIKFLGLRVSPWISGAIVCTFLFNMWSWNSLSAALAAWPLISVAIIAVPQFVRWDLEWKVPPPNVRQDLILLLLMSIVMSSWLQFYFRIQTWLDDYPTIAADNFNQSGFVYAVSTGTPALSQGFSVLSSAEVQVKQQLEGMPWPRVERWLLNLGDQIQPIEAASKATLDSRREMAFWGLRASPYTTPNGYELKLQAVWRGPTSQGNGYYLQKSCLINPKSQPQPTQVQPNPQEAPPQPVTVQVAHLECDLKVDQAWGQPG